MDANESELEAIQLRFRAQNPSAPADAKPTPEQAERFLSEVRENEARVEQAALDMLRQASRNSASFSGMNSKYMQLLFVTLLIFAVGGGAVYLVVILVSWILRIRL